MNILEKFIKYGKDVRKDITTRTFRVALVVGIIILALTLIFTHNWTSPSSITTIKTQPINNSTSLNKTEKPTIAILATSTNIKQQESSIAILNNGNLTSQYLSFYIKGITHNGSDVLVSANNSLSFPNIDYPYGSSGINQVYVSIHNILINDLYFINVTFNQNSTINITTGYSDANVCILYFYYYIGPTETLTVNQTQGYQIIPFGNLTGRRFATVNSLHPLISYGDSEYSPVNISGHGDCQPSSLKGTYVSTI